MKKITPIILLLVMTFMMLVSWNNILSYKREIQEELNRHLENAEKLKDKEIYIDAVKEYEAALRITPEDYELAMKIVDLYVKLDDTSGYLSACENAIKIDSTKLEPYKMIADYYLESASYSDAYSVLHRAEEAVGDNDEISSRLIEVMKQFNQYTIKYDTVKDFYYFSDDGDGYAVVGFEGKYGLISTSGSLVYECEYDDIGFLSDNLIPIKKDGEYYYLDENGYRKLVTDETADFLGTFCEGYAPASFGGVYGYIDDELNKYNFEYSFAGGFSNGIAAVKKNNKWAVINTSFEEVVGFEFDEILLNDYGYCTENGLFFAKKGGNYFLYNKEGECLAEGFEDVRMFVSNEPAAVKKGGKWGFISVNGDIVIEPKYDEADSFNVGYAPFKEKGKWGCINVKGEVLIEPQFDLLRSFARNGYAYSETDGMAKYVVVNIYE